MPPVRCRGHSRPRRLSTRPAVYRPIHEHPRRTRIRQGTESASPNPTRAVRAPRSRSNPAGLHSAYRHRGHSARAPSAVQPVHAPAPPCHAINGDGASAGHSDDCAGWRVAGISFGEGHASPRATGCCFAFGWGHLMKRRNGSAAAKIEEQTCLRWRAIADPLMAHDTALGGTEPRGGLERPARAMRA